MSQHPGLRRPSYFERQRRREAKQFEPVVFKPITRRKFMAQSKVKMLNSVFGHNEDGSAFELVAGEEYWLDYDKADEWILKGYADGQLSKDYSDDEKAQILSNVQYIVQQSPGGNSDG